MFLGNNWWVYSITSITQSIFLPVVIMQILRTKIDIKDYCIFQKMEAALSSKMLTYYQTICHNPEESNL
jgi:nucleoside recognition membrane protein YjiH